MIIKTILRWPKAPVILLFLSIFLFLIPAGLEGPLIFRIKDGHGMSIADLIALIPLLISLIWIQRGLWRRRIYLFNRVTLYPGATTLIIFLMGLGLGMLLANAFYQFRYWWAVGGTIFILILSVIVWKSGKQKIDD